MLQELPMYFLYSSLYRKKLIVKTAATVNLTFKDMEVFLRRVCGWVSSSFRMLSSTIFFLAKSIFIIKLFRKSWINFNLKFGAQ